MHFPTTNQASKVLPTNVLRARLLLFKSNLISLGILHMLCEVKLFRVCEMVQKRSSCFCTAVVLYQIRYRDQRCIACH